MSVPLKQSSVGHPARLCSRTSFISLADDATGAYYYLRDHLGSVLALMNGATGEIVESYEYEPYGMPTITSLDGSNAAVITASTVGNRFLYTGREWDADAELYHYRFRTYSPREHRFMQSDPIGLGGGWNYFSYVGGNPVNFRDSFGLQAGNPWPITALQANDSTSTMSAPLNIRIIGFYYPPASLSNDPKSWTQEDYDVAAQMRSRSRSIFDDKREYIKNREELFAVLDKYSGKLAPGSSLTICEHGGPTKISHYDGFTDLDAFKGREFDFSGCEVTFQSCDTGGIPNGNGISRDWTGARFAYDGLGSPDSVTLSTGAWFYHPLFPVFTFEAFSYPPPQPANSGFSNPPQYYELRRSGL